MKHVYHIGVRGGRAGGHVSPPQKNFQWKHEKNENSLKLREQSFAEEFTEMGVGVACRLVGCCRARLLLSGTKVDFVWAGSIMMCSDVDCFRSSL